MACTAGGAVISAAGGLGERQLSVRVVDPLAFSLSACDPDRTTLCVRIIWSTSALQVVWCVTTPSEGSSTTDGACHVNMRQDTRGEPGKGLTASGTAPALVSKRGGTAITCLVPDEGSGSRSFNPGAVLGDPASPSVSWLWIEGDLGRGYAPHDGRRGWPGGTLRRASSASFMARCAAAALSASLEETATMLRCASVRRRTATAATWTVVVRILPR